LHILPTRHARSAWLPDQSVHPKNRRRHGLAICRELGDQDGETAALTNLGITLEQPGQAPLEVDFGVAQTDTVTWVDGLR
jgi:hypothetical protein